jgi:hypothetical protein
LRLLRDVSRRASDIGNAWHRYWRPAARHGHRPLRQDVRETGPLDPALGRALNKTLELRREADYDLGSLDPDDVRVRCKTPKR